MFRPATTLVFGLSLFMVLGLEQPVAADPKSLPAHGSAVGQITSFELNPATGEGVLTYVDTGKGSVIGKFTEVGTSFINVLTGEIFGFFETVANNGKASISGSYTGFFQPIEGTTDTAYFLTVTFEEGTGKLEGVSGEATVTAIQNAAGEFHYAYVGRYEFDN